MREKLRLTRIVVNHVKEEREAPFFFPIGKAKGHAA